MLSKRNTFIFFNSLIRETITLSTCADNSTNTKTNWNGQKRQKKNHVLRVQLTCQLSAVANANSHINRPSQTGDTESLDVCKKTNNKINKIVTFDLWHVICDLWYLTLGIRHMTCDRWWGELNLFSKGQLPV